MQDPQNIREIDDRELNLVCGGSSHSPYTAYTDAAVSVHASAAGGYLHFDAVIAKTKSISITTHGESISSTVGFALAFAL